MSLLRDISGQKFNSWLVIGHSGGKYWRCRCECGNERPVHKYRLVKGLSKSCGCRRGELISARIKTHGLSRSKVFAAWSSMLRRCLNPNAENYPRYGGRGITVCADWANSFENFFADMGHPPEGMSLDRKDNDGNYEPDNCRWATAEEQARNRSNRRLITYDGRCQSLGEWAKELEIGRETLRRRLEKGWSVEDTIGRPLYVKGVPRLGRSRSG